MNRLSLLPALAACLLVTACTDGATRIAEELQTGAGKLQRSNSTSLSLRHVPEKEPEGCAAAYTLQLSANAGMLIWCKESVGGRVTSSHITTSHLRFIDVPQTWIVDKAAGEATLIDLEKRDGKIVVAAVR